MGLNGGYIGLCVEKYERTLRFSTNCQEFGNCSLLILAVACPVSTVLESYMTGNTSRPTAQTTTIIPRSSDDVSKRCFTSGMDVIDMFGYKPVRSVITDAYFNYFRPPDHSREVLCF